MTKQDATIWMSGFICGALLNDRLAMRKDKNGGLVRRAVKKGLAILLQREAGFFDALERVIREELEATHFNGEAN